MTLYQAAWGVHVSAAAISIGLFVLRLLLDAFGRPDWRATPLRWLPHANDSVLLAAALLLATLTGWWPIAEHWLTAKVLLLVGYILAGMVAMNSARPWKQRAPAAMLALLQVALIVLVAVHRPL